MFDFRLCPACFKDCLIVRDSRKKGMCIRRKRECLNCGHIMRTTEITDSYFDELQRAKDMLDKIKAYMEGEKT
jgi:transcriptional regulator NrdR family protein